MCSPFNRELFFAFRKHHNALSDENNTGKDEHPGDGTALVQQETDAGSKTDDRLCIGAKLLHSTHGIAIRFQRGNQIHQAIEDHQCRHNIERDTDKRPSEQHGHKAGDNLLSRFVPDIFIGIAFDSGGVASGPMTSTFLLPLSIGVCEALGGNLMTDAFGVVALVALTPLIAIQLMGLVYKLKTEKRTSTGTAEIADDCDAIVDLEEGE